MKKIVLVNEVLAFISLGQKEVFLTIQGDKKHNVQVKKEINSHKPFSELVLRENLFNLKIDVLPDYEGVTAYIKSPNLPNPKEWYKVGNFLQESAYQILSEVENENGCFGDEEFEVAFIESKAVLVNSKMSNYSEAMNEMTRRFYIEIGKKTKKWVPGHRYDCKDGTYYYLGKYLSRKKEEFNSTFFNTQEELTEVHIYAKELKHGEKKISDVFRNGKYGVDLFVRWDESFPSCVDSGSSLEDDAPSLQNLYTEMFNNAIPEKLTPENLKTLFDVLNVLSIQDTLTFPKEISIKVRDITKDLIKSVIFNNWNIPRTRTDREIGKDKDINENINKIKSLLLNTINDGNILGKFYYEGLFNILSIDLEEEIKEWLENWNEDDLTSSFSIFRENAAYFLKRTDTRNITSVQRAGDKEVKITDLFGTGELGEAIKDLTTYAATNYGEGSSDFNAVKINKIYSCACTITLEDLLKFRDTPELREEILKYKFSKAIIYFDKDRIIE